MTEERKERPGFLFPYSGFLGNDWAVMVLSLNSPNETRGPASPDDVYFSPYFIFSLFFVLIRDIKIIHTESAFHLYGSPLFSSLFSHLLPPIVSCTFSRVLGPKPGFVAC